MAAHSSEEDKQAVYKSTYGMCFFGTPHRGMIIDDIKQMVSIEHPRSDLLQSIEEKSTRLQEQLEDFKNILKGRKVVSFYEKKMTRGLVFVSSAVGTNSF
jgi:hypothetical protein